MCCFRSGSDSTESLTDEETCNILNPVFDGALVFSRLLWLAYEGQEQQHSNFIAYMLEQRPRILAAFPGLEWFAGQLPEADATPSAARSRRSYGGRSRPPPSDTAHPALVPLPQPDGQFQGYMQYVLAADFKITVRLEWQRLRIWVLPAAADGTREFVHIVHSIAHSEMASSESVSCSCGTGGSCVHLRLYEEVLLDAVGPPTGAPGPQFAPPAQRNLWTEALLAGMAHPQDDDAVLLCTAPVLGHTYWSVLAQTVDGPQPAVVCQKLMSDGEAATGTARVRMFAECSVHTVRRARSGHASVLEDMTQRCAHVGIVNQQCDLSEAPVRAGSTHRDIAFEDGAFRYVGKATISRWRPRPCWSYQRAKTGAKPGARTADRDHATAQRLGQAIAAMDEANRKSQRKSQQAGQVGESGEIPAPPPAALRVPLTEAEKQEACACGPRSRWVQGKFFVVLRDRRVPAMVETLVCRANCQADCASEGDKVLTADGAALGLWQYGRMFYDVGLFYDLLGGAFGERGGLSLSAFFNYISSQYDNADLLAGVQGTPPVSLPTLSHAAFSFFAQLDPAADVGVGQGCPMHKFGCPQWITDATNGDLPVARFGPRSGGAIAFDKNVPPLPPGLPLQVRMPISAKWEHGKVDQDQNGLARVMRTRFRHLAKVVEVHIALLEDIHTARVGSSSSAGLHVEEQRIRPVYAALPGPLQTMQRSKKIIAQSEAVRQLRRDWKNVTPQTYASVLPGTFFHAAVRLLAWLSWSCEFPTNPWLAAFPAPHSPPDLREVQRLARVVDELGSEACIATLLRLNVRQQAVDVALSLAHVAVLDREAEVALANTIRLTCPHLGDYLHHVTMHEDNARMNQDIAAAAADVAADGVAGQPPGPGCPRSVAAGLLTKLVEKLDEYVLACEHAGCPVNMPQFHDVDLHTEAFCGGLADGNVLKAGGRSYLNPSGRQIRLFYPSAMDKSKTNSSDDDHEGGCDKRSLNKRTRGTVSHTHSG